MAVAACVLLALEGPLQTSERLLVAFDWVVVNSNSGSCFAVEGRIVRHMVLKWTPSAMVAVGCFSMLMASVLVVPRQAVVAAAVAVEAAVVLRTE